VSGRGERDGAYDEVKNDNVQNREGSNKVEARKRKRRVSSSDNVLVV
jgi:hypothetical protein